ncbi:Uu.00g123490.m01.CDS01 [Anthostomella pinea]|uniref:Uu.00g123490.m01.CDS01 n=1 Tax=Anthostomella pinea TaxID=933095 RepID=A0AAI8VHE2_9PEZI|nr:Uu.00g123490.m01.CDS01 [Anthostomella pinea]
MSGITGRRVPLSSNQNAANSPLRGNTALKQKRTLAQLQREEPYGQPPPAKKQILEGGIQRSLKSPSQQHRVTKSQIPVQRNRNATNYEAKLGRERSAQHQHTESASTKYTEKDIEEITNWVDHHRARFPKFHFYFDKVPGDIAHSMTKQIAALGGRESAFFSNQVTHVVTTRSIPTEASVRQQDEQDTAAEKSDRRGQEPQQEQTETINPSLLTRFSEESVKRRIFDAELRARKLKAQDEAIKQPKRNMDILIRAREMGMKIWPVDKLSRMLAVLLENDPYRSAEMAYGSRSRSSKTAHAESRTTEDRNLLRLLQNERVNGPSDRDPTVLARELHHFKGPYIYVYDVEEKQKPIMVREYPKVQDKAKGDWPQFQTAALGRCPFVEDSEAREARESRRKAEAAKAAAESKPALQPPKMAPPKPMTGKRTLGEMESGHNRQSSVVSVDGPKPAKPLFGPHTEFRTNAFTSRAASGRMFGGEPVASGVQPSNVTSAIRSQMISSTAATPGVVTGLSKEVHGLQRQVLKRNSTATSRDHSSRHTGEASFRDDGSVKRPLTLSRASSRKLELIDEAVATEKSNAEDGRSEQRAAVRSRKRDLKPGYCENCAVKYADFDEHIDSNKHRKFADNDDNWLELDDLLSQLERTSKQKPYTSWKPSLSEHGEVC